MKSVAVVALSVLALAGSVAGAEARGLKLRGSIPSSYRAAVAHAQTGRRAASVAAVASVGLSERPQPDTTVVTRSVTSAQAQAAEDAAPIPPMPPLPEAKPTTPWCASGRVAGSGTGFCLIN